MTSPAVSIVVQTHNNPEELEKTLHSILLQTFSDFEVIIVDDGLTARADEVVGRFNDPRFRYIAHTLSRGVSGARNTGVRAACSPLIAFLDAGDTWMSEKLAIQYTALNKAPKNVGLSLTEASIQGNGIAHIQGHPWEYSSYDTLVKNFKSVFPSTTMVRSCVFKDIGYFDETFPTHEYTDFIFRLLRTYRFFFIPKTLSLIHVLIPDTGARTLMSRIRGREMVLAKHRAVFERFPSASADHFSVLGHWCCEAGDTVRAKHYFLRAFSLSHNPRHLLSVFLIDYSRKGLRHRQPRSVSQTSVSGGAR